jgi:hypothetical protein
VEILCSDPFVNSGAPRKCLIRQPRRRCGQRKPLFIAASFLQVFPQADPQADVAVAIVITSTCGRLDTVKHGSTGVNDGRESRYFLMLDEQF